MTRTHYERPLVWDWRENYAALDLQQTVTLINRACDLIPEGVQSILDVGCGTGAFLRALSERGIPRVVGVDSSHEALSRSKVPVVVGRAECLQFDSESFDLVACMEVIEHLSSESYHQTLAEIERVTKQYAIISVPFNENLVLNYVPCPRCKTWFHPDGHMRSFTEESMSGLFQRLCLVRAETVGEEKIYLFKRGIRRLGQLLGLRFAFPPTSVCPSCHFEEPKSGNREWQGRYYRARKLFQQIAPSLKRPAWILSLYEHR